MDKNNKIKNFMKKEGFYVVLFVCLCLVGTVAVVTAKKNVKQPQVTEEKNKNEVADNNNSVIEFDNAELVKEEEKKDKVKEEKDKKEETKDKKDDKKSTSQESNKNNNSVQTSATPKKEFIAPVKAGKVTRNYNIQPRIDSAGDTASVFKGIDIEVPAGSEVKSIGEGKIIEATKGDSKEGYYVKVEHSNGFVAVYANLDAELKVKVGEKVKQGTTLGKVGNTVQSNPEDRVSTNYLLFHMEKSKKPVDPQKYITDLSVKK